MTKYRIVFEVATDNGNPAKWDWQDLLDENYVNLIDVQEIPKMGMNDPDDKTDE